MVTKKCDHTSVGILVWQDDKLLLIERRKFPFGFAPPAGHVDENPNFETAAKRELQEEVGLQVKNLKLLFEERRDSPCRRPGGTWHYWKIYEVRTDKPVTIKRSLDETKQAGWYSKRQIRLLGQRTERYLSGQITEKEWRKSPGLEVAWYEWLIKERKII